MAYLDIKQLTKSYNGSRVLGGIDIELEEGVFLSLLGPSGCGKTTTMRIAAGFEHQDAGTIAINGQAIDKLPPYKRNIGMVFQSYALFPHMTAAQNIAYGLEQQSLTREEIRKETAKALEMVQLSGFEQRKPRQLSGGQQQRVALARALVTKPSLLLLDESLSALDKNLRSAMQIELRMIQKNTGITTIFVTHDQEEAMTLSDRIAVMRSGKIEQTGSPHTIYEQPANMFVAGFIGRSNFLKGKLLPHADSQAILELANGDRWPVPTPPEPSALKHSSGQSVVLSIRPERIQLQKDDALSPVPGLKGTVKLMTYAGSTSTYVIDVRGQELHVQRQNDDEGQDVRQGDEVYLSWSAESQNILLE
ncbi:ABC transporter ATP-binding protein [Paenibacillus sp. R14(2021)]|uniref:ABC transporter ATP-binding protein n=1 Tax=Paenibacillus sp. R14(2021) TaxID=2859228 RepID=UPI001C612D08|nr:ABC transporter ATP-binding protein [Paenibacillus sp. R14(2021)]